MTETTEGFQKAECVAFKGIREMESKKNCCHLDKVLFKSDACRVFFQLKFFFLIYIEIEEDTFQQLQSFSHFKLVSARQNKKKTFNL